MVEPPFAASAKVASERDTLLATKLHVPTPHPDLVPRPRLAERLDEGLARGLTLVCAPAGYGKMVLLADWARRSQQPVAWLSLDVGDNDPARFWRHGVAALDQALLVLDDYHLIDSEAVHSSLGFLLEHRPPELRLVLASRSDPPLALARLRGRGQLAEVRAAELRFTADEATALLRQAAAVPDAALPDTVVAALAARTEGWAAGLQLAALSLRGQPDAAGFVAAFTGSHRFILDFLAEEVLEQQSDEVRTFLLDTSVLERLSGDLCDAVTGRTGSQTMLEQVERAGLFLVPLDEVRGWWRYHHLFADLLRARLQAEQPGRAARLHRNAAAWYDEHEMADNAIPQAMAADEMAWAVRLIEQHFDELFYLRGEGVTVQRWLFATTFAEGPARNRAMSVVAAMSGGGAAVGLVAGGVLTTYLSWRWVLFVNVPIGLLTAVAARLGRPESARNRGRFDLPGAVAGTGGVALLVYGLSNAGTDQSGVSHWGDTRIIASLTASALLLAGFVIIEARSPHALMPLRILANRSRSGAYLIMLALATAMSGIFFFLSIFVQSVLGYSALRSGVVFLPLAGAIVAVSGILGQLIGRIGARPPLLAGAATTTGGMFWFSRLSEHSTYLGGLLGPMLVTGLGLGLLFVPLSLVALSRVPARDAGLASSLLNTGQQVGGAIGLAALGTVAWSVVASRVRSQTIHAASAAARSGHAQLSPQVRASIYHHALAVGITRGFLAASGIALASLVIKVIAIRIRREDLAGMTEPAQARPVGTEPALEQTRS